MKRRRFLALATLASGGISGCSASDGQQTSTPGQQTSTPPTVTDTEEPTPAGTSTSPPADTEGGPSFDLPWESLRGPPGGPVTDMAIHPTDPNWMYATTQTAGMYVTSDGGRHWLQGNESMHHRASVWVSPHDPKVAYTAYDRTENGGRTWTTEHSGRVHPWYPDVGEVHDLAFDPYDEETHYVGTEMGLYRTRDDGDSWNALDVGGTGDRNEVRQVVAHSDREGVLAAAVTRGAVYESDDRGETWSMVEGTDDVVNNLPRELVLVEGGASEAFVSVNGAGMFRIGDGDPVELTGGLGLVTLPYFSSSNPLSADGDRLYFVGGLDLDPPPWSEFELYVFDRSSGDLSTLDTPEVPVSVTAHPNEPSTVYLGGTSRVFESRDGGSSWEPLPTGFQDRYLTAVGVNPSRPGTVIPGTYCSGGLFVSHDHGESFDWKRSGLSPFHDGAFDEHYVMQIAARGDHAYATTAAGLLISADNGETWRLLRNEFSGSGSIEGHGGEPPKHLHGLAVSPRDPLTVYVGTGIGGIGSDQDFFDGVSFVWKSEDGGETWRELSDGFPTNTDLVVHDILVSEHDPAVVYLGTNAEDYLPGGKGAGAGVGRGIFRSTNGGSDWEHLTTPFSNVHALAEDSSRSGRLFASTPRGVFRRSEPEGDWTRILEGKTKGLLTHPSESDVVFAGTQRSPDYWDLLVSVDGGDSWGSADLTIQVGREPNDREYDGMDPHADYRPDHGQIMWLAFEESSSHLYATTRGAGLWRSEVGGLF